MITRRAPESIGERAAEEAAERRLRHRKIDAAVPASASVMPRRVSITGTNVEKLSAVSVRSTTMR